MDDFKLDLDTNSIFDTDISIDDILAEFDREQAEEQTAASLAEDYAEAADSGEDLSYAEPLPDYEDDFPYEADGEYDETAVEYNSGSFYEEDSFGSEEGLGEYPEESFDDSSYSGKYSAGSAEEPVASASKHNRGMISSMRSEARRFIAQIQSRKAEESSRDGYEEEDSPSGDLPDEFSEKGLRSASDWEYELDDYSDLPEEEPAYAASFEEDDVLPNDGDYAYDAVTSDNSGIFSEEDLSALFTGSDSEKNDTYSDDISFDTYGDDDFAPSVSEEYEYDSSPVYEADPSDYSESVGYPRREAEPEIDSRFNIGGRARRGTMTYGSRAVDLAADESYTQAEQPEYNPSQWAPDYDDPLAEVSDDTVPKRKTHKFRFGKKKQVEMRSEVSEAFDAVDEATEYAEPESGGDGASSSISREEAYFPPTFKEYVFSIFASVFLKLRGTSRGDTNQTMSDTEEDLGPEVSPAEAASHYGSFAKSMKLRLRISFALLAILCYVSLGFPVPGMLKHLPVAAMFCFALQTAIMLLALDVVTTGILNAFRRRIGADTLAVLCCILTGADALLYAVSNTTAPHLPLCAVSSVSLVGLLLSASMSTRGLRKTARVPAIGRRCYVVSGEVTDKTKELTLLKSMKSIRGFIHRAEEAGPDETLYCRFSPFVLVFAFLLSIIVALAKNSFSDFLFIFSAILIPAVPFGAMLSFALPFFLCASRVFRTGGAIAGWSGLCDIGNSKNLIVTDRDIFPENCITMESVRIFADEDAQKVISYAGTMMSASGSSSAGCFLDLMDENGCDMKQITGFEYLPGGGMKGVIEGHVVLCGSTDLMRLMNVRIPFRLTDRTTVLLAIDGILYGIFSLHYEPMPQVRAALTELMRSNRHPVFASADFNINPEMLHSIFDIATDGYDFPPYVERFALLKPAGEQEGGRIAAVVCTEGLGPLTHVADVGRSTYIAVRTNLVINAVAALTGILAVFIRLLAASSVSVGFLLAMMVLWAIPVFAVSYLSGTRK